MAETDHLPKCGSYGSRTLISSTCLMFVGLLMECATVFAGPSSPTSNSVVFAACKQTLYPQTCLATLITSHVANSNMPPMAIFHRSVQAAIDEAMAARGATDKFKLSGKRLPPVAAPTGMDDCAELFDDSLAQLADVLDGSKNGLSDDVRTWLSAAMTYQDACMESLAGVSSTSEKAEMNARAKNVSELISNSLALFRYARGSGSSSSAGGNNFPAWLTMRDRRLLEMSPEEMEGRLVVAKDGSGTHRTISEALEAAMAAAPAEEGGGGGRTVVHVLAGTYKENVKIPKGHKNVLLVGDGKGKTVITSDRSNGGGWTTFQSATFAATGEGFMARDITFENTAGPAKHQAVALRIGADKAVIYRCSVIGYQDSLYTLSNRQFYRETDIYGTVDFIFGNSAVVFQNCNMYARKPNSGQANSVTAQGRRDPNQNTGISIHNCRITAAGDLAAVKGKVPTYLGRPWQKFSRTVVMQTFIDDVVHPAGWEPWSGGFALSSLYYGEYMNSGPGAATGRRVGWSGYHPAMSAAEATKFTVGAFIFGNSWLPATGVEFDSGLHL